MSRRSPAPKERYINRDQLRVLIQTSDMTLWRWQRGPKIAFARPVKRGDNGHTIVGCPMSAHGCADARSARPMRRGIGYPRKWLQV